MILAAFAILTIAVGLGLTLAALHARAAPVPSALGLLHGLVGAAGFLALLLGALLPGGPVTMTTAGRDALALLAAALLAGTWFAFTPRGRTGLLLTLHGALAVIGYALLIALV